jgi:signal transduction histidine kinase
VNTARKALHTLGLALLVLLSLNVCWAAAGFLVAWADGRTGVPPGELVRQLAVSTAGMLIFCGALAVVSRYAYPGHLARFRSVIDAMGRLSRGDFSVSLDMAGEAGGQFDAFVRSFNDMAARLGALEKMRQEFVSNVSHEIRSPLASIAGFARALRGGGLSAEERDRYLGIIETECVRLSRLSDNLLKLAVLESDHPPLKPRRYRLDRQLREAVLACEPQWLEKSIDLDAELEPVEIVADPDLMNQVWANLLHNSIKFTPRGGTIGVRLRLKDGQAEVVVSDSGIGIGEEDLPRIFERFHKADRSRNREAGGSGLGLAIAKKIVDLHRGEIAVQSRPGEGAVFTVRLPVHGTGEPRPAAEGAGRPG